MSRPKWLATVEVGDVLKTPSGLRVVRAVHRWRNRQGRINGSLSFAIKRCSWTTRPYTVWMFSDSYVHRMRPTGKRKKLTSRIDRLIAESMGKVPADACPLHCHQVTGIA